MKKNKTPNRYRIEAKVVFYTTANTKKEADLNLLRSLEQDSSNYFIVEKMKRERLPF